MEICQFSTDTQPISSHISGHLTAMSDVYSFGVVLLELLTGRRSVDKNRPGREQNLVDWARPSLKDARKLNVIMDPNLQGQYSPKAAHKAAALACQCLSHHPKSRPTMTTVVKTLEPLVDLLDDMRLGPFIYTIKPENGKEDAEKKAADKKENQRHRARLLTTATANGEGGHMRRTNTKENHRHHHRRQRHRRASPSTAAALYASYSDTALYKKYVNGLNENSPRHKLK